MNCLNVYGPTVVNENAFAYLKCLNEMCFKMGVTIHVTCVTWIHVVGGPCHTTCLSHHVYFSQVIIRHSTPDASKYVKFGLSRNSTKFDVVARFRERIPTVKSVSSYEI